VVLPPIAKSQENGSKILLGLKDCKVEDVREGKEKVEVKATAKLKEISCPYCGIARLYRHAGRNLLVFLLLSAPGHSNLHLFQDQPLVREVSLALFALNPVPRDFYPWEGNPPATIPVKEKAVEIPGLQ